MPQDKSTRRYNQTNYIDGNTVRKLEPAPYRPHRPERENIPGDHKHAPQPDRQKLRRQQAHQEIAARNQARVAKMDLKYTLFLGMAVVTTLLVCVFYLSLQSQLTQQSKSITKLKQQLNTVTDANLATQERINSAIDLEKVYKIATEEMGMVYASEDQIVYYVSNDNDYVKQYKDIPQSGD